MDAGVRRIVVMVTGDHPLRDWPVMARLIPPARDRVRLVMPAADRVVEVVVALQRHPAPARLVVRYVFSHDYSGSAGSNLRSMQLRSSGSISNSCRNPITEPCFRRRFTA
jgi:hypothetical protein